MNLAKKLKGGKGFTLLEVLCAFLVLALSSGLFATSIGAAVRMNVQSDQQREAFYEEVTNVETKANSATGASSPAELTITLGTGNSAPTFKLEIEVYTGKSGGDGLFYYELK